jgi:hypothetical protein
MAVDDVKLREGAIEWREVEGRIVALDVQASEYLAVNRTGASIWPLLATGATHEQLAAHLATAYGIDQASAARHVKDFVDDLADRDLLEAG